MRPTWVTFRRSGPMFGRNSKVYRTDSALQAEHDRLSTKQTVIDRTKCNQFRLSRCVIRQRPAPKARAPASRGNVRSEVPRFVSPNQASATRNYPAPIRSGYAATIRIDLRLVGQTLSLTLACRATAERQSRNGFGYSKRRASTRLRRAARCAG